MFWKNWPYWIRGSAIGFLLYILAIISSYVFALTVLRDNSMAGLVFSLTILYGIPVIPIGLFIGWIIGINKKDTYSSNKFYWLKGAIIGIILVFITTILAENFFGYFNYPTLNTILRLGQSGYSIIFSYIILGALIGWIIGKIKSKKQTQQLNKTSVIQNQ